MMRNIPVWQIPVYGGDVKSELWCPSECPPDVPQNVPQDNMEDQIIGLIQKNNKMSTEKMAMI